MLLGGRLEKHGKQMNMPLVESKPILGKAAGHDIFEYYKHCADETRCRTLPTATGFSTKNHNDTIAGDDIAELQLKYEYSTVACRLQPSSPQLFDVMGLCKSVETSWLIKKSSTTSLRKCDLSGSVEETGLKHFCNSLKSALNILGNKPSEDTEIIEIVRKTLFN